MDKTSEQTFAFLTKQGRKVEVAFDEPATSSDGGAVLLTPILERSALLQRLAEIADQEDRRQKSRVQHDSLSVIRQRVAMICCGYYDVNDSDALRVDPAMVLAAGGAPGQDRLASQPTVSRLENRVTARVLLKMGYAFVDDYIASFGGKVPEAVVLDMDPTAVVTYGQQELGFFNAHEDEYCLMPFHVYDGLTGKLITTTIRPGRTPTVGEILAILKRLVPRLRAAWPKTLIVFRADSHHTKPEVMDWLDGQGVQFATGLCQNKRLNRQFEEHVRQADTAWQRTGRQITRYASGWYQADTWSKPRWVICRVKRSLLGSDSRYIVTSFEHSGAKYLYETVYCGRGNAELMIKDHKLDLGSGRASCHKATANQFRLFLHSAAYTVMHQLREALAGTELARARFSTLRLRLLKLAARVELRARSLRFHMPVSYPWKKLFARAATVLLAGPLALRL